MNPLPREIRHTPLLWMLIFVPAVLIAAMSVYQSWGLTKQAPNADKVLRLFRYVFGRYFVCVA